MMRAISCILVVFLFCSSNGAVISVASPLSSNTFGIVDAVAAASNGDVIAIGPGTYLGRKNCGLLIFNRTGVILRGSQNTVIDCNHESRCLSILLSTNIEINGITFLNGQAPNTPAEVGFRSVRHSGALMKQVAPTSEFHLDNNKDQHGIDHSQYSSHFSRLLPTKRNSKPIKLFSIEYYLNGDGEIIPRQVVATKFKRANNKPRENFVQSQSISGVGTKMIHLKATSDLSTGGCIYIADNSTGIVLKNVKISGGKALQGSGIGGMNSEIKIVNSISEFNGINAVSNLDSGGAGGFFSYCSIVISNSSFSDNYVHLKGTGPIFGGGLALISSKFISLSGPINANRNSIFSNGGTQYTMGGGIYIHTSANTSLVGPITASGNKIETINTTWDELSGGGMFIAFCDRLVVVGPITFSNNALITLGYWRAMNGAGSYFRLCGGMVMTGPITGINNTIYCSDQASASGGGLYFQEMYNIAITGPLILINNSIFSTDSSELLGAGAFFVVCTNLTVSGTVTVTQNMILSYGSSLLQGAGIYIGVCQSIFMKDDLIFEENTIISHGGGLVGGGAFVVLASTAIELSGSVLFKNNLVQSPLFTLMPTAAYRVNETKCAESTIVTQSRGVIGDCTNMYAASTTASWLLEPSLMNQAVGCFQIQFIAFNTEFRYDFVSLYDGPTTLSPLIGKYSGILNDNMACQSGKCPDMSRSQPYITSSGTLFVTFQADSGPNYNELGFRLSFRVIDANRTAGQPGMMPADPSTYPVDTMGGALLVSSFSECRISGAIFEFNQASNAFLTLGGAIAVMDKSQLKMQNTTLSNNRVHGLVGGGGAVAIMASSTFNCVKCTFDSNSVMITRDSCFYLKAAGVVCGGGFGGGLITTFGSNAFVSESTFQNNSASCNNQIVPCSVSGGSISVQHEGSLLLLSSVECKNGMSSNNGGCLYVDSASVIGNNSVIERNTVKDSGGAIAATGTAKMSLSSTLLRNNTAKQGGAINMISSTVIVLEDCILRENVASSIAGGLSIRDKSSFTLVNTSFENNIASRASAILSYNDDHQALYTIKSAHFVVPGASAALMLGRLNFSQYEWNCTHPGSVFTQDMTGDFFSLNCIACGSGTYALEAASTRFVGRTCQPCPFGAFCNGSSLTLNGLFALGGFWGSIDHDKDGEVTFHRCPSGYCCPITKLCNYDHCEGGRIGLLCGACPSGYGLRFFTENCGDDSECTDVGWATFLIIVGAVIAMVVMLLIVDMESSGMLSVLLYFYQVLGLVKSSPWKFTSSIILLFLQSVFNFSPSTGESGVHGVCIMKSMTASQKLGAQLWVQAAIFGAIIPVYCVHNILHKYEVLVFKKIHVKSSRYVATVVLFSSIAYTTLVLVPLQMLQCISVAGSKVWWFDGETTCFQEWQLTSAAAIVVLFPLPLAVVVLLTKKWINYEMLHAEWQKQIYLVLTDGYKRERRWYLGVSLYRRLLLVMVYTMIQDANWRGIATIALCTLFVALHLWMRPYKIKATQYCETWALVTHVVLAALTAPQLAQIQFGTVESVWHEDALEYIQFALAVIPLVAFCGVILRDIINFVKTPKNNVAGTNLAQEKLDDSLFMCLECGKEISIYDDNCAHKSIC